MAQFESLPACCGIHELGYVARDKTPVDMLMSIEEEDLRAHVIFSVTSSQTRNHSKGNRLAEYIRENKLGDLIETAPAKNNYHRGTLKAYIWTPDHKAFKKWQEGIRKKFPDKYPDYNNDDPYWW